MLIFSVPLEQSSGNLQFLDPALQESVESIALQNASSTIVGEQQSFDFVCSTCQNSMNLASTNFVPNREKLEAFLKSTSEGQFILASFELTNKLSEAMITMLTHLLINRELFIYLKTCKFSNQNLLKKVK